MSLQPGRSTVPPPRATEQATVGLPGVDMGRISVLSWDGGHGGKDLIETASGLGVKLSERLVGNRQVAGPGTDEQVGLERSVEVRTPGRDEVVPRGHLDEQGTLGGRVAAVVAFHAGEARRGELSERPVHLFLIEAERERVGEDRHCA